MNDWKRTIWIATAPAGVWSSGPAVLYPDMGGTGDIIEKYRAMGWEVLGPYVLRDTEGEAS